MVNGHYILYGDKPSSESEIVDDHVQTRTAERKNKRKSARNANELQRTLNMAQLDNETDSVKYEKKIKEPLRLLRYVPTTEVQENFVTENFETYDLKPTEERPRRYAFQKKPKNPSDGSVNYAYSRSSSNCSSPNGNLPTISEHGEQYGTYRAQPLPSPKDGEIIKRYEHKLDKYFYKQNEKKSFAAKVNYEGSHPDSLYRVQASSGAGVDKMVRVLRILRWPAALVAVCIALAVFVYFLMPDNIDTDGNSGNGTYWEPVTVEAHSSFRKNKPPGNTHDMHRKPGITRDAKTPEIDFYNSEGDKNTDFTSIIDTITETSPHTRVPPFKPVFPSHIAPEVQYGNEKADANKLRTPKVLDTSSTLSDDSTLKPHITQKPEKPLAIYFEDLSQDTTTNAETFSRAETVNEFANYGDKQTTKNIEISTKSQPLIYKDHYAPVHKVKPLNIKQYLVTETEIPPEIQKYNGASAPAYINANFTSGHSKLFGISIEDAEKMRSTTQSSQYNTRVSPTLPTWRDGDDTTTKHYPVNINYEVVQCRSTRIPLCSGILPYDLAGLPATIAEVDVSALLPQITYLVALNCSERVREFACALLEPECNPPRLPPKRPCYNLCKSIVDTCDGMIPAQLSSTFDCQQYSHSNCVDAKGPCYDRELTCSDGSCIPREWICDEFKDCPSGEDEVACTKCQKDEFRCKSGSCIPKRWICDGYTDCPYGDDENDCDWQAGEVGEESAGSAPAPVVRRPNRLPLGKLHKTGENDSSKELLVTSDSSNAFKRNFTRRPSLSRLTPYTRTTQTPANLKPDVNEYDNIKKQERVESTHKPANNRDHDSTEDFAIGDLGFFDELKKTVVANNKEQKHPEKQPESRAIPVPVSVTARNDTSGLDKSVAKLEKVINVAALLKKSQAIEEQEAMDSLETNSTTVEKADDSPPAPRARQGSVSAHASPCPSGELRCVDGRCITLAQLCDGTIDCTDHADEDNCYT